MRCTFQIRQVCDPRGCTPNDPGSTFIVLRLEDGQYGRCDDERPCDWYPLRTRQDRGYLHLDFADGLQGAKLTLHNRSFIETVSFLDMVMISFGRCQP